MGQSLGRILVVDDDPDVVNMVIDYFAEAGYEVIGAHHGGDGLMLAEQERPDIVLLDIRMPGMSGVEVLQQIHVRWPERAVVIVSGAGDVDLAKRSLRRGAFDYVQKPFDWEYLHRCVAAALTGALAGSSAHTASRASA
jgi:two-component system response regulator AtoC